ncbi:hypothetical protein DM02DRAFT_667213 [Periconia macrospinosa]|uniref:Azaphilone pigments biosynthesis cluster protein L N-terminal domain-containing protein n=1 Tax=Periconia macrospinosa TaxID=97972 RepID=A0A2V1E829_9PLEO|nr:hypothetical protein DM02DRAFT_667213 [Periconia macrospinosa]
MAEPISMASGLLTLVTFVVQASTVLYNTVQSLKNHTKRVRDLKDELEALNGVLEALADTIRAINDLDLSALKHILFQCGKACENFQRELLKCSSRSGGSWSFRDWARLRYSEEDINGFRQLLAGYKGTISIALNDANLRKSSLTAETFLRHGKMTRATTEDLEERLRVTDRKVDMISHCALKKEGIKEPIIADPEKPATPRRLSEDRGQSEKKMCQLPLEALAYSSFSNHIYEYPFHTYPGTVISHFNCGGGPQNNNTGTGKQYNGTYQVFGKDD